MAEFKIKEAIARAEANGLKVKKIDLAEKIWPGRNKQTLQVNMTNLCNGSTQRIAPEWVDIICKELKVDPNFLFNIEPQTF